MRTILYYTLHLRQRHTARLQCNKAMTDLAAQKKRTFGEAPQLPLTSCIQGQPHMRCSRRHCARAQHAEVATDCDTS
jgi:hypothetical protein